MSTRCVGVSVVCVVALGVLGALGGMVLCEKSIEESVYGVAL